MTLIVGQCTANTIYLVSDMKLTPNSWREILDSDIARSSRQFHGALKLVILSPEIAVGFAGNSDLAFEAISRIYSEKINFYETEVVLNHFLRLHRKYTADNELDPPEFIVASLRDTPGLHRVRLGSIQRFQPKTWIGSPGAFSQFERYESGAEDFPHVENEYHNFEIKKMPEGVPGPVIESYNRAALSFEKLLRNEGHPEVDGIRVELYATSEGFKYSERVSVTGRKDIPRPTQNLTGIHFGTEAHGSFSYHVLGPNAGLLGIYYYTGNLGFIFTPTLDAKPAIITGVTKEQFDVRFREKLDLVWNQGLELDQHLFPYGYFGNLQ